MARRFYAMTPADYAVNPTTGAPLAGAVYEVYLPDKTTRVLDLLNASGTPTTTAVSDSGGRVRFQGADGNPTTLYLKAGSLFYEVHAEDLGVIVDDTVVDLAALADRVSAVESAVDALGGTPIAVPTEPLNVRGVGGNTTVTLNWDAPESDGGSVLTGYRVTLNGVAVELSASTFTYQWTSLTNGTVYQPQVQAVNIKGAGPGVSATVTPASSVSNAPAMTITGVTDTTISFDWAAPTSPAGTIAGYKVGYTGFTSGLFTPADPYTLTGLTANTTYDPFIEVWYTSGSSTNLVTTQAFTGSDGAALPNVLVAGFTPTGGGTSIQSNRARFQTGAAGSYAPADRCVRLWANAGTALNVSDSDQTMTFRFDSTEAYIHIFARNDTSTPTDPSKNVYSLEIPKNGNLALYKIVNFAQTMSDTHAFGSITINTDYKLRLRCVGGVISASVWLASGSEPGTPQMELSDGSPLSSGNLGISVKGGAAASNSYAYFDDATVTDGGTGSTTAGARTTRSAKTNAAVINPPGSTTVLPAKVVGMYWFRWSPGPTLDAINALPSNRRPNFFSAAIAQSAGSGTGSIEWSPTGVQSQSSFISAVTTSKGYGAVWVLCIGGGGDGGITLTSTTHENQMIASIKTICDTYGFQGIDWDLEHGNWTATAAKNVSVALKAHYGSDFLICASPRPYEMNAGGKYRDLLVQLGSNLDFAYLQFYDFNETRDDTFLKNYIMSRADEFAALGIPRSKYGVGCIVASNYSLGWNESEVYRDGFKAMEAKYPNARGVIEWESKLSAQNPAGAYRFLTVMNPSVRGI